MPTMTQRSRTAHGLAVLSLSVVAAVTGHAATDGTLGPTSTAQLGLSATIASSGPPAGVRISGIQDINQQLERGSATQLLRTACIYHSSPTVSVTVSQTGGPGELRLVGPDGQRVLYRLRFRSGGQSFELANTGLISGFVGDRTSETCSGGSGSELQLTFEPVPDSAPAGLYTGSLMFMVAPE